MTTEDLQAKIAALEAENVKLKQECSSPQETVHFKISPKGCVSAYGLGSRFPVSLYQDQWRLLIDNIDSLKSFMLDNASKLKSKPQASES